MGESPAEISVLRVNLNSKLSDLIVKLTKQSLIVLNDSLSLDEVLWLSVEEHIDSLFELPQMALVLHYGLCFDNLLLLLLQDLNLIDENGKV